ncbi:hypothetical protein JCM8097_006174 [Rhodosporidiobolus ruineniae]
MVQLSYRPHTYPEWRPAFLDSRMPFKQYNEEVYEPWLKRAYTLPKPYYLQPSHLFTKFDSEYARAHKEQAKVILCGIIEHLGMLHREKSFADICLTWRRYSKKQRQDLCLLTWARQARRAETAQFSYRRDDTPELVLSWADDPYNFEDLVAAQVLAPGSTVDYRIVPNKEWSALNEPPSCLPLSRGLREYIETGFIDRHLFLARFTVQLIESILGLTADDDDERSMIAVGVKATKDDISEARRTGGRGAGPIVTSSRGDEEAVKRCSQCLVPESQKKLTVCGKCKEKQNRMVWFCGRECQVSAWPKHKIICGKPLADSSPSSVPPYDASRSKAVTPRQLEHLKWLRMLPRVVWAYGTADEGKRGELINKRETKLILPSFVTAFRPALDKLVQAREDAFLRKDDVSIGILGLFVRAASPYAINPPRTPDKALEMLALHLEFKVGELERAMVVAEEEILRKEEFKVERAALAQLKDGKTSGEDHYDDLLRFPTAYFSFPSPALPSSRHHIPLPDYVQPFARSLAAVREITFRALESGGRDELAVGITALLVRAAQGYGDESQNRGAQVFERYQFDGFGREMGLPEGKVTRLRDAAQDKLEEQEGEEWELVKGALAQLEKAKADRSRR